MKAWTIIIIGATGDLSRRRLIPTLYEMIKRHGTIPGAFIGAAKESLSIETLIKESIPHGEPHLLDSLITRSSYQMVDFENPGSFSLLAQAIKEQEKKLSLPGNRLVYLAIGSEWYGRVTAYLSHEGIIKKSYPIHRVIYEKPFGWDAPSAHAINECITQLLDEEQIYRVDHYISKALVTSLLLTRLSNVFFEPVWNRDYIDQVQIILSETDTVQKRGSFYDRYGALKDVVQNHMLQLLSCIGMEKPPSFSPDSISTYKSFILQRLEFTDGLLGQYKGYKEVPGVSSDSTRETYALLRAEIDTPRWQGVPFYLKTGKALDHKSTEIHLIFKPQKLPNELKAFDANRLILRISPDSALLLKLNVEKVSESESVPVSLEFCYRCTFGAQPHSYETLFYDVMKGDKSVAIHFDEIIYAWEAIKAIKELSLPLYRYTPGSSGPEEAEAFEKKYDIRWSMETMTAQPEQKK